MTLMARGGVERFIRIGPADILVVSFFVVVSRNQTHETTLFIEFFSRQTEERERGYQAKEGKTERFIWN
jgi:hypothetical protein